MKASHVCFRGFKARRPGQTGNLMCREITLCEREKLFSILLGTIE